MESDDDSRTLILDTDTDDLQELSEYLDVLSSGTRLKILRVIARRPKDVRQIASEIETSYENTKKHLDRLMSIGVVRKEAGLSRPTARGIHPVWKYSLVPGSMEAIIRNLGLFSNMRISLTQPDLKKKIEEVRGQVANELDMTVPYVMVLGGPDDGRIFPLIAQQVMVGRIDPGKKVSAEPGKEVVLSADYTAVSRVSRPHGRIVQEHGQWYFVEAGSTGGSFLNAAPLQKNQPALLRDGDLLDLSRGPAGARLLFIRQEREA